MSIKKGFSVVEILIVIVVIGLLAAAGWLVYDRQKSKTESKEATTTQVNQESAVQTNSENETATKKIDTIIHDVDITMQTATDINKLPEYTPASFREYMLGVLKDNKFFNNGAEGVDTITEYSISKISQANIVGGRYPVDKNGVGYSGAPAIWVLTPTGEWDQESLNGPSCKSKNGGLIYEEFAQECARNADGTNWGENPNGSIKSLAQ